jgi:hypothetical protein
MKIGTVLADSPLENRRKEKGKGDSGVRGFAGQESRNTVSRQ